MFLKAVLGVGLLSCLGSCQQPGLYPVRGPNPATITGSGLLPAGDPRNNYPNTQAIYPINSGGGGPGLYPIGGAPGLYPVGYVPPPTGTPAPTPIAITKKLLYSISGLPDGSGLGIDEIAGIINGIPNERDLAVSPISVKVQATDEFGGITQGTFRIIITSCRTSADCSSTQYCLNQICVNYGTVGVGCGNLQATCLPTLFCFQGLCSECRTDFECGGGYCIRGKCWSFSDPGDPCGPLNSNRRCQNSLFCDNDAGICYSPPTQIQGSLSPATGFVGVPFEYVAGPALAPYLSGGSPRYFVTGLPASSGLSMEPGLGALRGAPTTGDLAASPMGLVVEGRDGAGNAVQGGLQLTIYECGGDAQCLPSTHYCDLPRRRCVAFGPLGGPCGGAGQPRCLPPNVCSLPNPLGVRVCVQCAANANCDGSVNFCDLPSGRCVPFKPVGAPCSPDRGECGLTETCLGTVARVCYRPPELVQVADQLGQVGFPVTISFAQLFQDRLPSGQRFQCVATGLSRFGQVLRLQDCAITGTPLPRDYGVYAVTIHALLDGGEYRQLAARFTLRIVFCKTTAECVQSAGPAAFCSVVGTCLVPSILGGPCDDEDGNRCQQDLRCGLINTLSPAPTVPGCWQCLRNKQCLGGQYCNAGTCLPLPTLGLPCTPLDSACALNLRCFGLPSWSGCYQCTSDVDCVGNQYCVLGGANRGSCVVPSPVTGPCDEYQVCRGRLQCFAGKCYAANPVATGVGIPDAIGVVEQPFFYNLTSRFLGLRLSTPLTFLQTGLPPVSGLALEAKTGVVQGIPTQAAFQASPYAVVVNALAADGSRAVGRFKITILRCLEDSHCEANTFCRAGAAGGDSDNACVPFVPTGDPCGNRATGTGKCAPNSVCDPTLFICYAPELRINLLPATAQVGQSFTYQLCSLYSAAFPLGFPIAFSLQGLEPSSGLSVAAEGGLLYGIPNAADLAASPLRITVVADDGVGRRAESPLTVSVVSVVGNVDIVDASGKIGDLFSYDVSEIFELLNNIQGTDSTGKCVGSGANAGAYPIIRPPSAVAGVGAGNFRGLRSNPWYSLTGGGFPMLLAPVLLPDTGQGCTDCCPSCCQLCNGGVGSVDTLAYGVTYSDPPVPNAVPFTPTTPPAYVGRAGALLLLDLAPFFAASPNLGSPVSFVLDQARTRAAFPGDSGLQLSSQGLLWGIPTVADASLASLTVSATDRRGRVAQLNLPISIQPPSSADSPSGTLTAPASVTRVLQHGGELRLRLKSLFRAADGGPVPAQLSFKQTGLARGTGLELNAQTGLLRGQPSAAEAIQQPLLLQVTATAASGASGSVLVRVYVDQAPPPNRRRSVKSCGQLGWTDGGRGLPGVCGASAIVLTGDGDRGACSGALTFSQAHWACASVGARLCTEAELLRDEAKGGGSSSGEGCGLDGKRVWSGDFCGDGVSARTAAGAAAGLLLHPARCDALTDDDDSATALRLPARCCADVKPAPPAPAAPGPRSNASPVAALASSVASTAFQAPLGSFYSLDASTLFSDGEDGDLLAYSAQGLPPGSGLHMDLASGELSGFPNAQDLKTALLVKRAQAPSAPRAAAGQATHALLYVALVASDGRGGQAELAVGLNVTGAAPALGNKSPLVTFPPPTASAALGQPLLLPLLGSFVDPDGDLLSFLVDGLPGGTGLALDRNAGVLSGTPTVADLAGSPLSLFITAVDGRGGMASAPLSIQVAGGNGNAGNVPPVSLPLADVTVAFGVRAVVDVAYAFGDQDRDVLTFEAVGLPATTGLAMDPRGFLHGVASQADLAAQSMQLLISASDGRGAATAQLLVLNVVQDSLQGGLNSDIARVLPSPDTPAVFTVAEGSLFRRSFANYFTDADAGLQQRSGGGGAAAWVRFSAVGLPQLSGFTLDGDTGTLLGSPSATDLALRQPLAVAVVAEDGRGAAAGALLHLYCVRSGAAGTAVVDPGGDMDSDGGGGGSTSLGAVGKSAKSCSQLGWSGVQGLEGVCSSSLVDQGTCAANAPWARAEALCAATGARLCSNTELKQGAARAAGCGLGTRQKVWTSDSCQGLSKKVARNANGKGRNSCLRKTAKTVSTVCCADDSAGPGLPPPPTANPLPVEAAAEQGSFLFLPMQVYFFHVSLKPSFPTQPSLAFQALGLRPNTGLSIDQETGAVVGVPSVAALRTSPIDITVIATDRLGQPHTQRLLLTVRPRSPPVAGASGAGGQQAVLSVAAPSTVYAGVGVQLLLDASLGFINLRSGGGQAALAYSMTGAPLGTGLRLLSASGVLFGAPTEADEAAGSPLLRLTVRAADSEGRAAERVINIAFGAPPAPTIPPTRPPPSPRPTVAPPTPMPTATSSSPTVPQPTPRPSPLGGFSSRSCEQLFWAYLPGNTRVCSTGRPRNSCDEAVSLADATQRCAAAGARLCSDPELQGLASQPGGLPLDGCPAPPLGTFTKVWTGTACPFAGQTLVYEPSTGVVGRSCALSNKLHLVRCCADRAN